MPTLVEDVRAALAHARLEAVFVRSGATAARGASTPTLEVLVRDTALHRARLHEASRKLGCTHVPRSEHARAITLVGAALPIHVIFGQLGSETYAAVRARATPWGAAWIAD